MMRLAALLVATALTVPAMATTSIAGLVNTGRNAANTAVTSGVVQEANWFLFTEVRPWNAVVDGQFPRPFWAADDATSRWLTPTSNAGDSFDPTADGFYTYSLNFALAGAPASASFTGRFMADNALVSATLNGTALTLGGPGSFSNWTSFASNGGFLLNNVLEFVVRNEALASGNPTGLRVEFLSSNVNPVPEPASWAMLIAGFGLVGAAARRRRQTVAA